MGAGIAAWFVIPVREGWIAFMLGALAFAGLTLALAGFGRLGRGIAIFCLVLALGCGWIWMRAERMESTVLSYPRVATFQAAVRSIDAIAARDIVRLGLEPVPGGTLPRRVRVNVDTSDMPVAPLGIGDRVEVRACLLPPPPPALPGSYDFARVAWFQGLGATGRALDPVKLIDKADPPAGMARLADIRLRLTALVHHRLAGSSGGLAAAFVTGDQGAIANEDVEAMRISGLAHLLSISGLHVGAVIAATMILVLRVLALSPGLALRAPLPLIAGSAGAITGIVYTLIAGAEVPTVRACIAALLVLAALALGREAISLRLVAAGALVVMLLWPEAVIGPSFQLSFAAMIALTALHESARVQALLRIHDECVVARAGRGMLGLVLTGLAIEIALAPIALYHFQRAGAYGALANIAAIPLTTFVIMPLEMVALLLEPFGVSAPFWWLAGHAISLLLAIAHHVSNLPGSNLLFSTVYGMEFALIIVGGLWFCLWRGSVRIGGVALIIIGGFGAFLHPKPDLLITGDGRHMALLDGPRTIALLRDRTGDYTRDMIGQIAGIEDAAMPISTLRHARCNTDICMVTLNKGDRSWSILATRSAYFSPWGDMIAACAGVDIVVSDRRLPRGCVPRLLRIDRTFLLERGGLAISLAPWLVRSVRQARDDHPWRRAVSRASYPQ